MCVHKNIHTYHKHVKNTCVTCIFKFQNPKMFCTVSRLDSSKKIMGRWVVQVLCALSLGILGLCDLCKMVSVEFVRRPKVPKNPGG